MRKDWGSIFLIISVWLCAMSFLVLLFPSLRFWLCILGVTLPFKAGDLIAIASFFGASSIALWWNKKIYDQKDKELAGALNVSVDSCDRLDLKNQGQMVIQINEIHMKTEYLHERLITPRRLREKYNELQKLIVDTLATKDEARVYELLCQKGTNLSAGEKITLVKDEVNSTNEPVEKFSFVIRVICIKYKISEKNKFTRYVGMYRLTRNSDPDLGLRFNDWYIFFSTQDSNW